MNAMLDYVAICMLRLRVRQNPLFPIQNTILTLTNAVVAVMFLMSVVYKIDGNGNIVCEM